MRISNFFFVCLFGGCVAILWIVAALANFRFGVSQGTSDPIHLIFGITTTSAQLNGFASIAVDALKALLTIAVAIAGRNRAHLLAVLSTILFVGCVAWSMQAAFGYVLTERANAKDIRGQAAEQWTALRKDLDEAEKRRGMIPVHRPNSVVRHEMEKLKLSRRWIWNDECRNPRVTNKYDRKFCQEYVGLEAELSSVIAADELDKKIDGLRDEMDSRKMISDADPVAAYFGIDIGVIRAILFACLVETISGLGPWILWSVIDILSRRDDELSVTPEIVIPSKPKLALIAEDKLPKRKSSSADGIQRWIDKFICQDDGSFVTGKDARIHFCHWSGEDISPISFGRKMSKAGFKPKHGPGGAVYEGYRLVSGPSLVVSSD
jgi:hypothetical protein